MGIEERMSFIPAWHDTGASMDKRHILWIYELLVRLKPQRTLEIGSYHGCSSSAFIAAGVPDAHFADITVSQRMREVIGDKGTIHQRKGCDVLWDSHPFEAVLLDGAHDTNSVFAEATALAMRKPRVIIAHDINSSNVGFAHCEGARDLWKYLAEQGCMCFVDTHPREGERTDRGLLMATEDIDVAEMIGEAQHAAQCL